MTQLTRICSCTCVHTWQAILIDICPHKCKSSASMLPEVEAESAWVCMATWFRLSVLSCIHLETSSDAAWPHPVQLLHCSWCAWCAILWRLFWWVKAHMPDQHHWVTSHTRTPWPQHMQTLSCCSKHWAWLSVNPESCNLSCSSSKTQSNDHRYVTTHTNLL